MILCITDYVFYEDVDFLTPSVSRIRVPSEGFAGRACCLVRQNLSTFYVYRDTDLNHKPG